MSDKPSAETANVQPLFHDDVQLAELIGLSVSFLRKDRRADRAIPFMRIRGRILYDLGRVRAALLALEEGGNTKRARRAASG
jgi:hypothetical protein